jgi:hypothetical protein
MAASSLLSEAALLSRLSSIASANGGTASTVNDGTITGTLTAIKAKWLLGGRKVMITFRCTLNAASHEAHFRESAIESSWGLPPPTFTVETTFQTGARVTTARTDKAAGRGGRLEFGRFREDVEKLVNESGWKFVFEVA